FLRHPSKTDIRSDDNCRTSFPASLDVYRRVIIGNGHNLPNCAKLAKRNVDSAGNWNILFVCMLSLIDIIRSTKCRSVRISTVSS
ncbi:MAG: hypothetical protein LBN39_00680, partial [Planctomycetaceae bacterium]|nr:hypothetical protein [Planctomycetaceae bacterium]